MERARQHMQRTSDQVLQIMREIKVKQVEISQVETETNKKNSENAHLKNQIVRLNKDLEQTHAHKLQAATSLDQLKKQFERAQTTCHDVRFMISCSCNLKQNKWLTRLNKNVSCQSK